MGALLVSAALASVHASHHGVRDGDDILWTSHYDAREVPLADPTLSATPVKDGVLTAVGEVHIRQHGHDGLHPPLAAGEGIQRVTVDGYTYTPAPELGLERHVDGWMRPGTGLRDRLPADRLGRDGHFPVYITGADSLPGELSADEGVPLPVVVTLAGTFAGLVVALETGRRLLARQVKAQARAQYLDGLGE